jgi:hypothetical protein
MSAVAVLLTLAAVAAVGALVFVLGRRHFRNTAALPPPEGWPEEADPARSTTSSRLHELERLRRAGEIDVVEYESRKRDLLA